MGDPTLSHSDTRGVSALMQHGLVGCRVVCGANEVSPYSSAPTEYRLIEVENHVIDEWLPLRLINPEDLDDTRSPGYHLLDEFPVNFCNTPSWNSRVNRKFKERTIKKAIEEKDLLEKSYLISV